MTYRAKMQNGEVIFEGGIKPADGVELRVDVVERAEGAVTPEAEPAKGASSLSESLLKLAGRAKGLPKDAALNHDHYLYGLPKK